MKIMFVCHGNICRSPMAEFVFKDIIRKNGLESLCELVCSSATSTEEIYAGHGNPVYPPAARKLAENGIADFKEKRAVQLCRDDYGKYDLFIGMDSANVRNMHRIFGNAPGKKIRKLKQYESSRLCDINHAGDVADPWYSGDFDTTYNEIHACCIELAKRIKLCGKNGEKAAFDL